MREVWPVLCSYDGGPAYVLAVCDVRPTMAQVTSLLQAQQGESVERFLGYSIAGKGVGCTGIGVYPNASFYAHCTWEPTAVTELRDVQAEDERGY